MASPYEDIQKMLKDLRNPGMSRTPAPGTISKGDEANGTSVAFSGGDSASVRRPGLTGGVSSVGTAPTGARVARNARVAQSGAQGSRTATESKLNPKVGEALRRSLIEQERLRGNMRAPGSVNPVQFRAMMAERQANQEAVDSNLSALQGIRQGGIEERGMNLAATGALEDRQMQEAGAFDRALLGLDEAAMRGQFGLAGIEAEGRAKDPYAAFGLDMAETIAEDSDINTKMGLANWARGLGTVDPAGNPYTMESGPAGTTITGPTTREAWVLQEYQRLGPNTPAAQAFLTGQGLAFDENGRVITLAESDARAAAEQESREKLENAEQWTAQQRAFAEQQRRQRVRQQMQQQDPRSVFPDLQLTPQGGVR